MMTPAACSANRLGHVEVDPCRRVGSGSDQVTTCNHETGSYECRAKINRDVATFPSVLSYRRVQFLEKVLLYFCYVSFNCVL